MIPWEFCLNFWLEKRREHWLSCGVVCVILVLIIFVQLWLVTDRQTVGWTHDDSIYCASIASRGTNGTATLLTGLKPCYVWKFQYVGWPTSEKKRNKLTCSKYYWSHNNYHWNKAGNHKAYNIPANVDSRHRQRTLLADYRPSMLVRVSQA